jgi:hypothetical protein
VDNGVWSDRKKSNKALCCLCSETVLSRTLQFISKPHVAKMSDLQVTFFHWLNIDNLEMELIEFQESSTWVNKFVKLGEALEEIGCAVGAEYSPEARELDT